MSIYESNTAVPLGAITTHRIISLFDRAIRRVAELRVERATNVALSKLSQAQLSDIGLDRPAQRGRDSGMIL